MRPSSSWLERSPSSRGQSLRPAVAGLATSTRRSTTRTADSPEAAAPDCSQARCRQEDEHHFGSRPVALTLIGPPHLPHLDASCLRACVADSAHGAEPAPESPAPEALGCGGNSSLGATPRAGDLRDAFRRLPMPAIVRMDVLADVTPMRHDGRTEPEWASMSRGSLVILLFGPRRS